MHTIKARIPFKVYLLALLMVLVVVCVVIAVRTLRPSSFSSRVLGTQAANGAELAKPEAPASHHPVGVEMGTLCAGKRRQPMPRIICRVLRRCRGRLPFTIAVLRLRTLN